MSRKSNHQRDNSVQNKLGRDTSGLPDDIKSLAALTCESCDHWHREEDSAGQCRALPPDQPTNEFRKAGRLFSYRLTLSTLPACGHYMTRALSA